MNWQDVLDTVVKIVGLLLTIVLGTGIIFFVYRALSRLLEHLIKDTVIARAATILGAILLGLRALEAALSFVTQPELSYLHRGLTDMLDDMASVIQWLVMIAVLLFIGYALQGWSGPPESEETDQD